MEKAAEALNRWTVALLLASVLLPSLIFVTLQFGFGYRAERQALETTMLARADAIMAEIDGNMQRTRASALALASASSLKHDDWRGAYDRARELKGFNYDWASVRLIDVQRGEEIFDLNRPFGPRRRFTATSGLLRRLGNEKLLFEGIRRDGLGCPCMLVDAPVRRDGVLRYILVVVLDPHAFQKELVAHAPAEGTSAVVDTAGNFIARTRDFHARLGTPATRYVLKAVRSGDAHGVYRAITYEGLANYTVFSVSPVTGWSTHVAVPKAQFDTPKWWSHFASTTALVFSLILAVGLVWAFMRVMAARRSTDRRLQEVQRLEAVGMMTGGIAHDFNNMLAIVMGSLEIARRHLVSGRQDVQRHLDNAMSGASRAAELTRRLLAFSRRQTLEPMGTDVNALLTNMEPLLRRSISEEVRLQFALAPGIWPVLIDRGQLENGLVNLAVNARDAMPLGGLLDIATANAEITQTRAKEIGLQAGDYVLLSVTDSGEGMSEKTIRRAFEPFFTTKEVGRGTGLGLSQLYGFIDQSGGRARIISELGRGTTVEIHLPRFDGAITDQADVRSTDDALATGARDETILVVEDEAAVRLAHVEALRELGYSVFHAANGVDALNVLAERPVDLLFTDIVMPGMNGRELAQRVRERDPTLKILFTTGWERDASVWTADEPDPSNMLTKPFTLDQLARKVREIFDR